MRKMLIVTSALFALGVGGAAAQDFRVSDPNAGPGAPRAGEIQPSSGAIVTPRVHRFSAADNFGPSSQNDAPGTAADAADATVTASTGVVRKYNGFNAADTFGASY